MFGGLQVLEMLRNQDMKHYRQFGDVNSKSFFLVYD